MHLPLLFSILRHAKTFEYNQADMAFKSIYVPTYGTHPTTHIYLGGKHFHVFARL